MPFFSRAEAFSHFGINFLDPAESRVRERVRERRETPDYIN